MLRALQVEVLVWHGRQKGEIPKFERSAWPGAVGKSPAVEVGGC
jgi:hypothetical protein